MFYFKLKVKTLKIHQIIYQLSHVFLEIVITQGILINLPWKPLLINLISSLQTVFSN